MRKGLALLAVVAVSTAMWAAIIWGLVSLAGCDGSSGVMRPPERYQQPDVWVPVHFVPNPQVTCAQLGLPMQTGQGVAECGVPGKYVIMPDPCHYATGDQHADWECHAIGHFLGWSPNHPK